MAASQELGVDVVLLKSGGTTNRIVKNVKPATLQSVMKELKTKAPRFISGGVWVLTCISNTVIATFGRPIDKAAIQRFRWALCAAPMGQNAVLTLREQSTHHHFKSVPEGQTHSGLQELLRAYYSATLETSDPPFLAYCDRQDLDQREMKQNLFDDDLLQCEYRKFDPQFPFHCKRRIREIREQAENDAKQAEEAKNVKKTTPNEDLYHPARRYQQNIRGINEGLRDHFRTMRAQKKYDKNHFETWWAQKIKENPNLQFKDLHFEADIPLGGEPNWSHCKNLKKYINTIRNVFDFPLAGDDYDDESSQRKKRHCRRRSSRSKHSTKLPFEILEEQRKAKIFRVLQHCILFGCCPGYDSRRLRHNQEHVRDFLRFCYQHDRVPKVLMTITDYVKYEVEADALEDTRLCQTILGKRIQLEKLPISEVREFLTIFAAKFSHGNYNFVQHLISSHQRDQMHRHQHSQPQLGIVDWI